MKKKLIAILSLTLLFTAFGTAAYADGVDGPPSPDNINATLISANVETQPSYVQNRSTVTEVRDGFIGTSLTGKTDDMNDIINYTTTQDTVVYDRAGSAKTLADVKKDTKITVFTSASAPAPLILPPQYRADVIIIDDQDGALANVDVDTYTNDGTRLVNAANSLALNLDKNVKIVDKQGKAVAGVDLDKKDLLVFYTVTTRSIPAQTTPLKVVVLGNTTTTTDVDYTAANMVTIGESTATNVFVKDNVLMVPLRQLAESRGMTVEWFGMNNAILLNSGKYSVTLNQNSYGVGKMVPQQLSAAPVLVNHLTYVPIDFFTDMLQMTTSYDHGHLFLVDNDTF